MGRSKFDGQWQIVGTKFAKIVRSDGTEEYYFWCPGCEHMNRFRTKRGLETQDAPIWQVSGEGDHLSFSPSLLTYFDRMIPQSGESYSAAGKRKQAGENVLMQRITTCHLFVIDGKINYCNDNPHKFNGKQGVEIDDMRDFFPQNGD